MMRSRPPAVGVGMGPPSAAKMRTGTLACAGSASPLASVASKAMLVLSANAAAGTVSRARTARVSPGARSRSSGGTWTHAARRPLARRRKLAGSVPAFVTLSVKRASSPAVASTRTGASTATASRGAGATARTLGSVASPAAVATRPLLSASRK
jgi:hypothetical protein